jgi:cell division initiation protein
MFTPQQIEQISFGNALFNGYDKDAVDEFFIPLTEDYVTLYKENALLKSKMRVLVGKLEEYRANEASMKEAIVNAQKTCDTMVKETEAKCAQMLADANVAAAEHSKLTDSQIAAENARLEEARQSATDSITQIENQLKACLEAMALIRERNNLIETAPEAPTVEDPLDITEEISQSLESLVGTTVDTAPKAEPKHPVSETTNKFANLQFGRNYDPTK